MNDKVKLTGEMIVSNYDQLQVAEIIDELHIRIDALRSALINSRKFIQHINEVENSSCFYGCTCGAESAVDDLDAAVAFSLQG